MSRPEKHLYEFGPFRLDPAERRLLRGGEVVQLEPKAFDLLVLLVENGGHLLGKDELMNKVWPEAFVEEGSLTKSISNLRKALGEGQRHGDGVQFIETVPKRGYRFAAGVKEVTGGDDVLVVEEHTRARVITEEEEPVVGAEEKPHELERKKGSSWWRRPAVALAGGLMLVGVIAAVFYFPAEKAKTPARVSSIAVLPFKSLNPEAGDEYLGLGMADTLITSLSSIKHLAVRPTSAVRKYADGERDPLAAGREQRVDAVLDGSIQKSAGKIRVTARLVNVRDGSPLWAGTFDEKFTEMFAVEDLISQRVAGSLARELTGDERNLLNKRYTDNKEAYQLYLKGRYFWNKRTKEGAQKGISFFQQAVEADPQYALAYAGLADSHIIIAVFSSTDPSEEWLRAKEAALKALEIDDTLCEAHASLGFVRYWYEWDWAGAEAEYRRAIDLNPNYATAHHWYALLLASTGRPDPAVAEIERAQELDPSSLIINQIHGWILYLERRNDEAIEQLQKTFEMDPNFGGHYALAQAYLAKGMPDEAIAEFLKEEADPQTASALRKSYEASGLRGFWRKKLDLLREEAKRRYMPPSEFAEIYARLGEKDQALAWLEKAYAAHDGWLVFLKVHPKYDSLRSDPRFAELLRRVGLPQ